MQASELDVRGVVHGDRHPLVFSRFDALNPGEAFILISDYEPSILRHRLRTQRAGEFQGETLESGPERWVVRIHKLVQPGVRTSPSPSMQAIRDEHRDLRPYIEGLRALGESIDTFDSNLRRRLDAAVIFLQAHLLTHARAKEQVIYPAIALLMGSPEATATMSRDHVEIARLASELAELRTALASRAATPRDRASLRRLVFGLHALVTVHFAKEEDVYLPLLEERLAASAAQELITRMQRAAAELHTLCARP